MTLQIEIYLFFFFSNMEVRHFNNMFRTHYNFCHKNEIKTNVEKPFVKLGKDMYFTPIHHSFDSFFMFKLLDGGWKK